MSKYETVPHVSFSVRTPAGDGKWHFEGLMFAVWGTVGSRIPMEYPPSVGDQIILDPYPSSAGDQVCFRVVDRQWMHSSYGSGGWRYGEPMPHEGPWLDCIIEAAPGLYQDEAPLPPEEEENSSSEQQ